MKKSLCFLWLLFIFTHLASQNTNVAQLVKIGIKLHDSGNYQEPINKYQEALAIDSTSSFARYEMAFTYFVIQQYDKAITNASKILASENPYHEDAYAIWGNCLDEKEDSTNAIKVYEEGIKRFPNNQMLYYNYAFTCRKCEETEKAKQAIIKAIALNPSHASSHYLLSELMLDEGQEVKAILGLYYAIMLNPVNPKALNGISLLNKLFREGVTVDTNDENNKEKETVNIIVPEKNLDTNDLESLNLMIKMYSASRFMD